jgi:hypothetical protein
MDAQRRRHMAYVEEIHVHFTCRRKASEERRLATGWSNG